MFNISLAQQDPEDFEYYQWTKLIYSSATMLYHWLQTSIKQLKHFAEIISTATSEQYKLLLKHCLYNSRFEHYGQWYRQVEDTPMSLLAPVVVDLPMQVFEKKKLHIALYRSSLWLRYVVDTLATSPHGQ